MGMGGGCGLAPLWVYLSTYMSLSYGVEPGESIGSVSGLLRSKIRLMNRSVASEVRYVVKKIPV